MKTKLMLLTFCFLALSAAEARADDFVITQTTGFLLVETSDSGGPFTLQLPPTFVLAGPGLQVVRQNHIGGGDVGSVQARDQCFMTVCLPGTVVATNSTFSGLIATPFSTTAVVNGVFFSDVNVTGALTFTSPPIVIPDGGRSEVTVPFTFTGVLTGESQQPGVVNPIFTATLSGQGEAIFNFHQVAPLVPRQVVTSIFYRFQPVPEPATIVLLGTGMAGVVAAVRRRRSGDKGKGA